MGRDKEKSERVREIARERVIAREKERERVREGETAGKTTTTC